MIFSKIVKIFPIPTNLHFFLFDHVLSFVTIIFFNEKNSETTNVSELFIYRFIFLRQFTNISQKLLALSLDEC